MDADAQVASLAAVAIKKKGCALNGCIGHIEWSCAKEASSVIRSLVTIPTRQLTETQMRGDCDVSQRADKVSATVGRTRPRGDARSFSARITNRVLTLLATSWWRRTDKDALIFLWNVIRWSGKEKKKKKINRCSAYIRTNKKTSGVTSSEPGRANVFQILLDLLHEFAR